MSFYTWGNSGIEPHSGSENQLSRNRQGPPHGALQSWGTAMEHYVGLDVSLKLTAICIVDRTGKIEREGMVASDPETIAAFIKSHAPHVARVGLEARGRRLPTCAGGPSRCLRPHAAPHSASAHRQEIGGCRPPRGRAR